MDAGGPCFILSTLLSGNRGVTRTDRRCQINVDRAIGSKVFWSWERSSLAVRMMFLVFTFGRFAREWNPRGDT